MSLQRLREFLLPQEAELGEGFQAEVERLGRRALRVIGIIEIAMPVLFEVMYHLVVPIPEGLGNHHAMIAPSILLGVATYWSADLLWVSRYAREAAGVTGLLSLALGLGNQIYLASHGLVMQVSGSMYVLVILLVGLALLPLRPVDALWVGCATSITSISMLGFAESRGWITQEHIVTGEYVGLPVYIFLCTALAGVNHERMASGWQSQEQALRAAEDLRRSETRTLIAESAASMGRLAAAVSHELNSPLGAMKSAAETLPVSARRLEETEGAQRRRLVGVMEKLAGTIVVSSARIQEIVGRLQRFTNLDRAEVQSVDINVLLADVSALVASEKKGEAIISAELGDLPRVPCRPQQLSAVFSNLLHVAVERSGSGGRVLITAEHLERHIEISISDSGPSLSPAEVTRLFDPEFRVTGQLVTTGDWNLFAARRLVQQSGGDIRAAGSTFLVTLPCPAA